LLGCTHLILLLIYFDYLKSYHTYKLRALLHLLSISPCSVLQQSPCIALPPSGAGFHNNRAPSCTSLFLPHLSDAHSHSSALYYRITSRCCRDCSVARPKGSRAFSVKLTCRLGSRGLSMTSLVSWVHLQALVKGKHVSRIGLVHLQVRSEGGTFLLCSEPTSTCGARVAPSCFAQSTPIIFNVLQETCATT
jgi:hypothetical protein